MDFRTTDEQRGFAHALHDLTSRADPVSAARAWAAGDHDPGLALWRRLADQGVTALVVPLEHGGLGGSPVDLAVAFEVLGHQLAVGPWVESAAYLTRALPPEQVGAVADGVVATVAVPPHVPYAVDADVAALVHLVTPQGVHRAAPDEQVRSLDTTRHLFTVAAESDGSAPECDDAFDHAVLACSAQLLGCAERLLADTVTHVQGRRQYGRTIGSFQAVKHQLADVRIGLDFARPLVHGAAVALHSGDPAASRSVSAAKVAAGDAAHRASRVALQLHGAVGYTAELDLGLWIHRVRALVNAWGTTTFHRGRVADALPGTA
ncbi:MAG TPA: acyl-CoA dehydrogenase [Marmoricola sp.]|nr:acyl-CoA dehydrogenase [Marmoricola sp.]